VLGGAVTQAINWHWIFWINVPVGLALIPLSAARLNESFGRPGGERGAQPAGARLDLGGLALAGAGLLGLTWGLVRANAVGWVSGEVIGALVAGLALLAGFCWWERRTAEPMLSLALFRRVEFSTASAVSFFMYGSVFGALFLTTQFLQSAQHYSPLQTGLRLLPWSAAAMFVAPIAGKLADRYGNRPFMTAGMLLLGVGLGWVAAVAKADLGYGALWLPLLFAGIGLALVLPTTSAEVMRSVPMSEAGVASGTSGALRQLGGVFGVALMAAVFARKGVYSSPAAFTEGFRAALWVAVGLSTLGVLSALVGWPRPNRVRQQSAVQPARLEIAD